MNVNTNNRSSRTGKGKRALSLFLCLMLLFTMNGGAIGVFAAPAETEPLQITAAPQDAETPAADPAPGRPREATRSGEPYAYGSISMIGSQGYEIPATDTVYDLYNDTTGFITISYAPDPNVGTNNTVLVLTLPAYGMQFVESSLPTAGQNSIEARYSDGQHLYILLSDGMTNTLVTQIAFTTCEITQAQAEQWMDEGSLPATRFEATEYQLIEDGVYTEVLTNGSQAYPGGAQSADMTVDLYSDTSFSVVSGRTFKWGVVSSEKNIDRSLSTVTMAATNDGLVANYNIGDIRWRFPRMNTEGNTLTEIEQVKLYVPDARLKLTSLVSSNGGDTVDYVTGWTIGERQEDENGIYYIITPNARYFNAVTAGGKKTYFGFAPRFALVDANNTLDAVSYDETGAYTYKDYQAADTVVTYRVAGETESRTYTQAGPLLRVIPQRYRYGLDSAYPVARFDDNRASDKSQSNVVLGTDYNSVFTFVSNSWIPANLRSTSNVTFEYLPGLDGKIVQTYEFNDAAIQPFDIKLQSYYYRATGSPSIAAIRQNCHFKSLVYETLDGEVHTLTDAENAEIHDLFHDGSATVAYTYTFPTDIVTEENRVTRVVVTWDSFYVDQYTYNLYTPQRVTNGTSGSGANLLHTLNYGDSNNSYPLRTLFGYHVCSYHDDNETQPCASGEAAYVNYSLDAYKAEDPDNVRTTYTKDLYFRLMDPACPTMYTTTTQAPYVQTSYIYALDAEVSPDAQPYPLISMGSVGFNISTYGKLKDDVLNPKITFPAGQQILSRVTGIFNCAPKASGWTFDYTVKNPTTGDTLELQYTVPELTANTTIKLPVGDSYIMQSGYYLTSLSMHYDGILLLPHDSPEDTKTQIPLINSIYFCPLRNNPFTGERTLFNQYQCYQIRPVFTNENCTCETHVHTSGQQIASNVKGPAVYVYTNRTCTLSRKSPARSLSANTIPQGQGVTITLTPNIYLPAGINNPPAYSYRGYWRETSTIASRQNGQTGGSYPVVYPWGIDDTVYIELNDLNNFTLDYANSNFFGVKLTDSRISKEIVTVADPTTGQNRVFLKLVLPYSVPIGTNNRANPGSIARDSGGLFIRYTNHMGNEAYISSKIALRFISLPGAEEGLHYPVGDVFYDYSDLLKMYDAPNATAYNDNGVTNFVISGIRDTLGLASYETETEANIMVDHLGEGGSLQAAVTVTKTGNVGNTIVPGVNITGTLNDYDLANYRKTFTSENRENLMERSVIMGAFQSGVYNFNAYQTLPRSGKSVTYTDANHVQQTLTSDLTMMLQGPLGTPATQTEGVTGLAVTYTTDDDPDENSTYVEASSITDWRDVTGFRIHADYMPPDSLTVFMFGMYADQKAELGALTGYGTGFYTAQVGAPDAEIARGEINLASWVYTDVTIKGGNVFWDQYNENGMRDASGSAISGYESLIAGLPVKLYAPDGVTLIGETVTAASATSFSLTTYLSDAGQILEIGLPDGGDATVKLTKTSASAIGASAADNDFNRDESVNPVGEAIRLVLPALTDAGLGNISAGFVKLPELTVPDVSVCEGQTVNTTAVLTEYFRGALPAGSYNLEFTDAADTNIAAVGEGTAVLRNADNGAVQEVSGVVADTDAGKVTGVAAGQTTAAVSVKNVLGDEVTFEYTIHVTAHDWEFTGFTWTGSDEDGYTAAVANYKCENGETHYATVNASLTCVHTDPTCEAPGSDVYTAYVSAADSLDGEEHTEVKTVPIDPLGHNWVFTGFTWTGSDEDGYTAAVANYKCENGETHYAEVEAAFNATGNGATCEAAGHVVYTAAVTAETSLDGEAHSEEKGVDLDPLGHDWDTPVWVWTDETVDGETVYTRVTCTVPCKRDHAHDLVYATDDDAMHITLDVNRTPAGCEAEGSVVYTATVDANTALTDTRTVTLAAVGHVWGEPTWTWASHEENGVTVYDSATARFVCERDESHTSDLTDDVLDVVTVAAKCEEDGSVKYTAAVEFNGETYTDSKTVGLDALGHIWNGPTWTWESHEEDGVLVYTTATAHFVCERDASHTCDLTDDDLDVVTVAGACEENGSVTYTAAVEFNGEPYTDSRTVILSDAPGHAWVFAGFTWTGSDAAGYTAVANYVCSNGEPHYATVAATVTSERTEPTCTEAGVVVYTAAVSEENSLDAQAHAEEKTVVLPALGHDWGPWTVVREATFEEDGLERRVCNRCGLVEERVIVWQGNATREIQFVVSYPMHYIVHMRNVDYSVYSETIPVIYWYPEYPLTFDILIYSSWGLDGYIISANGKEIKPDANGVYTIPAGEEKVQINCDPIVTATSAGQEICEYCGKVHPSTVWGFLTGMIHRLFTYIKKMGG